MDISNCKISPSADCPDLPISQTLMGIKITGGFCSKFGVLGSTHRVSDSINRVGIPEPVLLTELPGFWMLGLHPPPLDNCWQRAKLNSKKHQHLSSLQFGISPIPQRKRVCLPFLLHSIGSWGWSGGCFLPSLQKSAVAFLCGVKCKERTAVKTTKEGS